MLFVDIVQLVTKRITTLPINIKMKISFQILTNILDKYDKTIQIIIKNPLYTALGCMCIHKYILPILNIMHNFQSQRLGDF